ncbi:DUF3472 domain-containing protein [Pinibacter aurantiacus]|uniref:DUF3472 domain-containing protein n=1 Tax=Pinibacter aurantiacus TaxID=2851599 RepID=A0A9E2W773_9BACT|nr:DUF3472 domain-containing protein [Pinibacter aurantiacus]MBV4355742.1 DUF3472 domain-containing protein [Pinibacter aurantiacus]
MKNRLIFLGLITCMTAAFPQLSFANIMDTTVVIPAGGNTFASNNDDIVKQKGVSGWNNQNATLEIYVRVTQPGTLKLSLNASTDDKSTITATIGNQSKKIKLTKSDTLVNAGEWRLKDTGYVKVELKGIEKTGNYFADIKSYTVSGTAINSKTVFVKNNEGNFFYWGRRGPSVHLGYTLNNDVKAEWFYNEITVPSGDDVIGSYYMANGFAEGYFGMQVNSATERRILFSIWSPYSTDDPKKIPADQQIVMLRKGEGVHTGEFGNEGSGGQSYLRYNWKAGNTYKFLLHAQPDNNNNTTTYTAYFFAPEKNEWQLIASFKRPKTNTYLKHLHSFLENFNPEQGNKTRKVLFGNQWICDVNGNWSELTDAKFTGDNTARIGYRMDYGGGLDKSGLFYLQNCGFFSNYTQLNGNYKRPATGIKPVVDFGKLP